MKTFMRIFLLVSLSSILVSCGSQTEQKNNVQQNEKETTDSDSKAKNEVNTMIANDEKIIEMLKKKGEIPEDATPEEINQALQKYLQNKNPGNLQNEKEKKQYINDLKEKIQKGQN
ncbi:hypothetical protein AWM68_18860 [Fictibacillus phosphorivorans]|uniref:Lipoprotein n=1 Tax=Fictibacillus phosphorivorans TaxID=1221500 RepID=A0A161RUD6_9BACL|nr:hypothetical protein [Fictibacillus phosphorivorans]KZE67826.1 hypothetical protein AWM68_18860 [Fictibacillus phosphorivorans]